MSSETKKDIKDSRKFLKDVAANWFRINVATPLSGSDMFNEAVKKNQIVSRLC